MPILAKEPDIFPESLLDQPAGGPDDSWFAMYTLARQEKELMRKLRPLNIVGSNQELVASWVEPSLDEIIAQIEFAYHHREKAAALGQQAAADMQGWTWTRAAKTILAHTG